MSPGQQLPIGRPANRVMPHGRGVEGRFLQGAQLVGLVHMSVRAAFVKGAFKKTNVRPSVRVL